MTKTQIWTAAFLGLFMLLFFLQRLTSDPSAGNGPMGGMGMGGNGRTETTTSSPADLSGKDIVAQSGCFSCHGADLKGTKMAPSLYNLASAYSRDKLINYLRNPNSFMEEGRFKQYKEQYKNIVMPSYGNKDIKDLGKIADYLLGLQ